MQVLQKVLPSSWHYPILTTAAVLVCCASAVLSDGRVSNFRCPLNPDVNNSSNNMTPFKNCDAMIKSGKIYVKCNMYASSAMKLPLFTNTTAGILVTDYMETYQDLDDILKQPHNSSCLRFISSRVQKLNFADTEFAKKYVQCTCAIPKEVFVPLMLIQLMDLHIVFNSDYANGVVHFNKTCLQRYVEVLNHNDSKDSLDVSSCIGTTDVVHRFRTSGKHFQFAANITMDDLFTKDFLNIILVLINEILFTGYTFDIPSLGFLTGLFKYLPTEALTLLSQKTVSNVEFQRNGFLSIRNDDIPRMDTLLTLDLSDCQIEFIEENAFFGVIYLKKLNLRGNKLTELSNAFVSLHNLQNLNLGGNGKNGFNEFKYREVMHNSTVLQSLDLSNMILQDFWINLDNLSKLKQLNLSNCSLNHIPISNISLKMPNLVHLNLSNNNLTNISIDSLSGLMKLQELDLSRNNLVHIPYNFIINVLPALRFFSLRANEILRFLPLTLNNDSAMRILDLSFNRITPWNKTMINSSERILNISLIANNITEVNLYMINDFDSLRAIQLVENPFDCKSCAMKKFLEWLSFENTPYDFHKTPYTCFFPKDDFKKVITNVTLDLCIEEFYDWISKALAPVIVVIVLVSAVLIGVIIYRWHLLYFIYLFRSKFRTFRHREGDCVYKYDAFVSYCTADRNWVVEHLIPEIENQEPKLHLCVHERDFEIGETIMNNVIECIDNSHKSIFVFSHHFIQSQWCHWELQMAQHKLFEDKRDVLIIVMLGEINEEETPKLLKRLILKRTYLQWPSNENGHRLFWKRLKDSIGNCRCTNDALL